MGPIPESFEMKVEQACQAGQQFSNLYYETVDKKRHLLSKLYQDAAEATWNGNHLKGKDAIIKFYEDLPSSEYRVESLDCQPLPDAVSAGQLTIIVKTFGNVKFQGPNKSLKAFHQSFMLTSQNNVWKIVSDNFRFLDKSDV